MVESADGNLELTDTPEGREAKAAKEEEDAQRYLAEQEARALQEDGAAGSETTGEEKQTPTAPDTKVVNGITHYLTVINGKERWLTLDQLRTTAQKVESADEYLASASASVRQAAGLALQAQPERDPEEEALAKTYLDLAMGSEEAARRLAAITIRQRTSVSPQAVREIEDKLSFKEAAGWFQKEYGDLLEDPVLRKITYEQDAALAAQNPAMDFRERLTAVGESVRAWRQKIAGNAPVRAVTSSSKLERKKALVNVPTAAARQVPVVDDDVEEDVEDIIAKMARARGQPRAVTHPGRRA